MMKSSEIFFEISKPRNFFNFEPFRREFVEIYFFHDCNFNADLEKHCKQIYYIYIYSGRKNVSCTTITREKFYRILLIHFVN